MITEAATLTPDGANGSDELVSTGPGGPFEVGEMVGETYRITGIIGRGGMGVVYEAEDVLCRRKVAIKATAWQGGEALLRSEAQAAAAVRHPGLPTVYQLGHHKKIPYLAMERLHGINLEEHLRNVGKLPLVPALAILIPLAEALAALHDHGLAHRDIKPANIMLCPNGRVVLVDFGITLPEVNVPDADKQQPMGTPTYMAPEAVAGTVKSGQAHLLDIYGFGGVAHEILSGDPPFPSDNFVVVLQQQLSADPPRLSTMVGEVPPALDSIVWRCLDKDPAERPSIDAVLWELYGLTRASVRGPRSVLIVDDDPDAVELLKACAATRIPAARVRAVSTCETALWQVRRSPPDLMFVDLSLPGMSGLELCSVLHEAGITRTTTIVAVSALQEDWILRALRNLGVNYFLPKGAGLPQQLVAMIDRMARPAPAAGRAATGDPHPGGEPPVVAQGSQPLLQPSAPSIASPSPAAERDLGVRPTQVAQPVPLGVISRAAR